MATHTPGPWRIGLNRGEVFDALNRRIVDNSTWHGRDERYPFAERELNARLIAAAPDLLAALQYVMSLVDRIGDPWKDRPYIDCACAAIAKATVG